MVVAIARDCAQHRIGERGEWGARRISARRLHREVDRRMVGRIEKQDLRRGDDKRPFERAAAPGQAFFQPPRQRLADRAEPAERDRGDRARQRPVSRVEPAPLHREVGGEPLFERARQGQRFARPREPQRPAPPCPAAEGPASPDGQHEIRPIVAPTCLLELKFARR